MLRVSPQIEAWASPTWITVGSATLLALVVAILVLQRSRNGVLAGVRRFLFILSAATLCGSLTWGIIDGIQTRSDRDALLARLDALAGRALTPGSPLACLDGSAVETLAAACEKTVFASPANVALADAYVAAQLDLLSEAADYVKRGGGGLDRSMAPLRRAIEADPFGFVAHVLAVRDRCTSTNCPALALLRDPTHVRTNLVARTLGTYLDHYREAWARTSEVPAAELQPVPPPAAEASLAGKRKVGVNIDFPSAASIPPINIMNAEPKGATAPRPAGTNADSAHSRAGKPQSAAPPSVAQTDPVWTPAPAQTGQ